MISKHAAYRNGASGIGIDAQDHHRLVQLRIQWDRARCCPPLPRRRQSLACRSCIICERSYENSYNQKTLINWREPRQAGIRCQTHKSHALLGKHELQHPTCCSSSCYVPCR